MKTKIFTLMFASILAMVFLIGGVSAVALNGIDPISVPSNVDNDAGSFNIVFNLTNTGNAGDLYYNLSNFTSSQEGLEFSFDIDSIGAGDTETITATISFDEGETGTITGNINVGNTDDVVDETLSFSVSLNDVSTTSFCLYDDGETDDNNGDLEVEIKDISVTSGYGDDDEWLIMDEIEIEIEVTNDGDWDIEDIELEWAIGDLSSDDWMIELDDIDEFDIDEGDEETFTVTFKIDESDLDLDLDELDDSYFIYVRATGKVDDSDSVYDGDYTCAWTSEEVSIEQEDDFVVLSNLEVQNTASCGDSVQITARVWNIGDDDQDDVIVKIYNNELGISKSVEYSEIEAYESESLNILIELPEDADEKQYVFIAEVYDEDNDLYENDYDDEESRETFVVKVDDCSVSASAIVTASLTSGGKAGQPLVITSTITNTGDKQTTFNVNAAAYTGWANSVEASSNTLIIDSGDSKQVIFTFDVRKDASGTNSFDIEVLSENQLVISQPVQVQIEKSGFSITGGAISSTTYVVAGSVLAVLILIAIVVLIIRLIK